MNKKNKNENRKDNIFNWANLLLALVSLVIAGIALVSITKVEGFSELLDKTSTNTIKLGEMITEQKQQNSLQQLNIDNNKSELDEIKQQTTYLIELQKSFASQLEIQQKEDVSKLIGDYFILKNLYWEIEELRRIQNFYFSIFISQEYREQTVSLLNDLKSVVYLGTNNKLLKMNDKIYSQWWVFYQQLETTINHLENEKENIKYYNIPLKISYGNGKTKNESETEMLNLFKLYFNTFWEKGVEPMIRMNEFRYYDDLYWNLSEHGRPIIK